MPLTTSGWLSRHVKEVSDRHRGTVAIAHFTEPVTNGREKLTIGCDSDMGLLESLWRIVEITKGLACLIRVVLKHAHPQRNGQVFFIRMEYPIVNRHRGILLVECASITREWLKPAVDCGRQHSTHTAREERGGKVDGRETIEVIECVSAEPQLMAEKR